MASEIVLLVSLFDNQPDPAKLTLLSPETRLPKT